MCRRKWVTSAAPEPITASGKDQPPVSVVEADRLVPNGTPPWVRNNRTEYPGAATPAP
jgi:hypothetical protein